jgi:hypothetical protein
MSTELEIQPQVVPEQGSNKQGSEKCELAEKILKQFEFYFSDANLKGDKFLKPLVLESDGCE